MTVKGVRLSELGAMVKNALTGAFPENLWVIAEIAELKQNRSGHCYLELVEKDEQSEQIVARSRATIWAFTWRMLKPYFETTTGSALREGMKVLLSVGVEFHEVYGFSLNVRDIDPAYTLGDVAQKRQEVVRQLAEDGVIGMNKELLLDEVPNRIAIISSPTAAGYEDFVDQLTGNAYGFEFACRLFPALMQGEGASQSIIQALEQVYLHEELFDVVVIIRGGGAQLDLYCFNDYELAMNVTQFSLPVLTGIGHEKDNTVVDLVAYKQFKTPTAVAGFLIDRIADFAGKVELLQQQFAEQIESFLYEEKQVLGQRIKNLKPLMSAVLERQVHQLQFLVRDIQDGSVRFLEHRKRNLSSCGEQVKHSVEMVFGEKKTKNRLYAKELHFLLAGYLKKQDDKLEMLEKTNDLLDPVNVLKRGYSLTLLGEKVLKSVKDISCGQVLTTRLAEGSVTSRVEKVEENQKTNN